MKNKCSRYFLNFIFCKSNKFGAVSSIAGASFVKIDPIACSGISSMLKKFFSRYMYKMFFAVVGLSGLQKKKCCSTAFPFT